MELLEYGPQYYQDGVTPLCDENGNQLVLTTIKDMISAQENEGYRVLNILRLELFGPEVKEIMIMYWNVTLMFF